MRIWSLHPQYLDSKGLVALWRESLLAQKVLMGKTKGYKNHPQLNRFKNTDDPLGAIASYLKIILEEAERRKYNFNGSKISGEKFSGKISVTNKQVEYEFKHLLRKLKKRNKEKFNLYKEINKIKLNPLFKNIKGKIENWEIL